MTIPLQEKTVYALDPTHTTVEFIVRHLMITKVRGRFTAFDGQIELTPGSDLPISITATIDAGSIDTREEQRDAHLRSADFFEVEKFPHLIFESTRIHGTPDDFTIDGKLTIRGVTRDVKADRQLRRARDRSVGRPSHRIRSACHDQPQRLRPCLECGARNRRRRRRLRGMHRVECRGRARRESNGLNEWVENHRHRGIWAGQLDRRSGEVRHEWFFGRTCRPERRASCRRRFGTEGARDRSSGVPRGRDQSGRRWCGHPQRTRDARPHYGDPLERIRRYGRGRSSYRGSGCGPRNF